MTLDEAILEMEAPLNYVVYRDANRDCLSVLVRRPDGNLDLIDS
jgi:Sigma 54 modulation/S30EA ribosomal protein C terminus